MNHEANKSLPLLAGYRLIEKIGSGGYGEVWSAEAPGGLSKAIKYVFGGQMEKRATHEARALEKIRQVRHPFLLSLERIETVDGRLLIVTELADGSLRDRFRACVEDGLVGIPRGELLGYLHDAADALDFLSTHHELAHLDVKPENLLLVAGHVKVADFGLVKSIGSYTQASLVGGMTPAYAAPEVFRGTPARASDQYSLAVVYQEMLAGVLPFRGENAAELTLQHMSHDPDVSPLSEQDRFVIARALSKDPAHRYESAVAFVDALRSSAWSGETIAVSSAAPTSPSEPAPLAKETVHARHSVTEVFEEESPRDLASPEALLFEPPPLEQQAAQFLEPGENPDTDGFRPTPALFIGVGGTGGKVLRKLRGKVATRLGQSVCPKALPMLLLDTDSEALGQATRRGDANEGLEASDTVSLSLRRPQEYRDKADVLLSWLGRRWLYNIPRSLKTEGIRPLGRLALIDHARRTFQRIRRAMAQAIDSDSREDARETSGLELRDGLRVYVVSSVAGGTGGGITLDIAYAVRAIAARLGVADPRIIGVLTHSTSREPTRDELARVNSYSWLSELHQFETSERGYPGDAGCGLPAHPKGTQAFDATYFSVLGRRLGISEFDAAVDRIAEYLCADAITPAQTALDAYRDAESELDEPTNRIRSFEVRVEAGDEPGCLSLVERATIDRLLSNWLGEGDSGDRERENDEHQTDVVAPSAAELLAETQLDPASLATICRGLAEASLGGDATARLEALVDEAAGEPRDQILGRVDGLFRGVGGQLSHVGNESLAEMIHPVAAKRSRQLRAWVLRQLDESADRFAAVFQADVWRQDHLNALRRDLKRLHQAVRQQATIVREADEVDSAATIAEKYFRLRLDEAGIRGALLVVDRLSEMTADLPTEITALEASVRDLRSTLREGEDGNDQPRSELSDEDLSAFAAELDRRIQEGFLHEHGGLLRELATDSAAQELQRALVRGVRQVVIQAGAPNQTSATASTIDTARDDAQMLGFGGRYRKLALVPEGASETPEGAAIVEDHRELGLEITEISGVSLPHLASALIEKRRDYAAFAERTRTRRDVPWKDPVQSVQPERRTPTQFATAVLDVPTSESPIC